MARGPYPGAVVAVIGGGVSESGRPLPFSRFDLKAQSPALGDPPGIIQLDAQALSTRLSAISSERLTVAMPQDGRRLPLTDG